VLVPFHYTWHFSITRINLRANKTTSSTSRASIPIIQSFLSFLLQLLYIFPSGVQVVKCVSMDESRDEAYSIQWLSEKIEDNAVCFVNFYTFFTVLLVWCKSLCGSLTLPSNLFFTQTINQLCILHYSWLLPNVRAGFRSHAWRNLPVWPWRSR
jgi:hypothetical protein